MATRKTSEIRACPSPRPANPRSTANRAGRSSGMSYAGSPRTCFFGNASRGTLAMAKVKYPKTVTCCLVRHCHVGYANRTLLLVVPRMAFQIVVQRLVPAIEAIHVVIMFQAANDGGHFSAAWRESAYRWVDWLNPRRRARRAAPVPVRSIQCGRAAAHLRALPAPNEEIPGSGVPRPRSR